MILDDFSTSTFFFGGGYFGGSRYTRSSLDVLFLGCLYVAGDDCPYAHSQGEIRHPRDEEKQEPKPIDPKDLIIRVFIPIDKSLGLWIFFMRRPATWPSISTQRKMVKVYYVYQSIRMMVVKPPWIMGYHGYKWRVQVYFSVVASFGWPLQLSFHTMLALINADVWWFLPIQRYTRTNSYGHRSFCSIPLIKNIQKPQQQFVYFRHHCSLFSTLYNWTALNITIPCLHCKFDPLDFSGDWIVTLQVWGRDGGSQAAKRLFGHPGSGRLQRAWHHEEGQLSFASAWCWCTRVQRIRRAASGGESQTGWWWCGHPGTTGAGEASCGWYRGEWQAPRCHWGAEEHL